MKIVIKTIATNERLIVFNESINIQHYNNNISFLLSQDDSSPLLLRLNNRYLQYNKRQFFEQYGILSEKNQF